MVLSGDNVHSRIVIDFLIGVHFAQKVRGDGQVMPREVPLLPELLATNALFNSSFVILVPLLYLEIAHLPCHLPHHVVLRACCVNHHTCRCFLAWTVQLGAIAIILGRANFISILFFIIVIICA